MMPPLLILMTLFWIVDSVAIWRRVSKTTILPPLTPRERLHFALTTRAWPKAIFLALVSWWLH